MEDTPIGGRSSHRRVSRADCNSILDPELDSTNIVVESTGVQKAQDVELTRMRHSPSDNVRQCLCAIHCMPLKCRACAASTAMEDTPIGGRSSHRRVSRADCNSILDPELDSTNIVVESTGVQKAQDVELTRMRELALDDVWTSAVPPIL